MPTALQAEYLQRAIAGDTVATTVLLAHVHARLADHLTRRIPRSLQSRIDAEDLLQETQVEVYKHVTRFEPRGEDSFYRWVATIALRRLRNAIKAHRTIKRGGGWGHVGGGSFEESAIALLDWMAGPEKTPSHSAARHEAVGAVQAALDALPAHYREAIRLVYLEGRSVAEAAAVMHRTERAVHNLCHKAKIRLRELLGSSSRFLSRTG